MTNPDGQTSTLPGGFTILSDDSPAPTVTRVTPNAGENTGPVSVTITGAHFQTGATVNLSKSGQGDIPGTNLTITDSQITGTFDLTDQATGKWDVVVTNPDTQTGRLTNGFTVTMVVVHDLAVTNFTASPNPVNRGKTVTLKAVVKNLGNVTERNGLFRITSGGNTIAGPTKVGTLKPGQQKTLTFRLPISRNTPSGEYFLTGEVSTVPGETNTANNSQTVKLTGK